MGVYTGIHPRSPLSRLFMVFSLVGVSLPTFLIGILLILVFAVMLGWLPSFGRGDMVHFGHWSTGFLTLVRPEGADPAGGHAGAVPDDADHAAGARRDAGGAAQRLHQIRPRARPYRSRAINFGHALKNTLVPVITVVGLQLGGLLAFSIVTETVFQWPGMGLLLVQSIGVADIPVMSAYLMLIAVVFVVINLVVDLLYFAVDPRLRQHRGRGK